MDDCVREGLELVSVVDTDEDVVELVDVVSEEVLDDTIGGGRTKGLQGSVDIRSFAI